MEFGERKKRILQAIIDAYIDSGEPVGSKHLSLHGGFGLSSATIRNEMSDLEDMGYLEQPHTSAGRIPSHLGYRAYVDGLMRRYNLSDEERRRVDRLLRDGFIELDRLMSRVSELISEMTNYTAVAVSPSIKQGSISRFELLPIDRHSFLLVLVTNTGLVKNRLCRAQSPVSPKSLERIASVLNRKLSDIGMDRIDSALISSIEADLAEFGGILAPVLSFMHDAVEEGDDGEVYSAGLANLLEYQEFRDVSKARALLGILNSKDELRRLLSACHGDCVRVIIGRENSIEQMRDSAVVMGTYSIGGRVRGTIGIVGPTRMDYARVISSVEYLAHSLTRLLNDAYED